MPRYYQLAKAGRVARRTGIVSLIFASSEFIVLLLFPSASASYLQLFSFAFIQALPALIILSSADPLERGNPAAFFVVFATAILSPLRWAIVALSGSSPPFGGSEFTCDIYTSLPFAFLLFTCKESLGDLRQLRRQRREDRLTEPREFAASSQNQPAARSNETSTPVITTAPFQTRAVKETDLTATPYRPRSIIASDEMRSASSLAATVGAISLIRALVLVRVSYLLHTQNPGSAGLDVISRLVLFYYLLPAALLIILAWRMTRNELWAFLLCTAVSVLMVFRILVSTILFQLAHVQLAYGTAGADLLLQIPTIYLLMKCIYAMPELLDIRRQRKRQKGINRDRVNGKALPAPTLASVVPPPAAIKRVKAIRIKQTDDLTE